MIEKLQSHSIVIISNQMMYLQEKTYSKEFANVSLLLLFTSTTVASVVVAVLLVVPRGPIM